MFAQENTALAGNAEQYLKAYIAALQCMTRFNACFWLAERDKHACQVNEREGIEALREVANALGYDIVKRDPGDGNG